MVNNGVVESATPVPASPSPVGPAAAPAEGEPMRLARREGRAPRDMILSLAVLLVPIALLLIFYRTVLSGDAPITVDAAPKIQEAQQAGAFPVAVPGGLGDDWHVSSATFVRGAGGATLRIGYVDPDKDPIQLVESNVPSATLLPAELTTKAEPRSTFRAATGVWRLYDTRPGERALVLADPSRTIIVTGKADVTSLQRLASSLG
jgi:hypothetical protein